MLIELRNAVKTIFGVVETGLTLQYGFPVFFHRGVELAFHQDRFTLSLRNYTLPVALNGLACTCFRTWYSDENAAGHHECLKDKRDSTETYP